MAWARRNMRRIAGWRATTLWLQVPLVAHDRIFANVKNLELLTKLSE